MGFSRQEHWSGLWGFPGGSDSKEYCSGLLFPFAGIFPTQGLHPHFLFWQVDLSLSHRGSPEIGYK